MTKPTNTKGIRYYLPDLKEPAEVFLAGAILGVVFLMLSGVFLLTMLCIGAARWALGGG